MNHVEHLKCDVILKVLYALQNLRFQYEFKFHQLQYQGSVFGPHLVVGYTVMKIHHFRD